MARVRATDREAMSTSMIGRSSAAVLAAAALALVVTACGKDAVPAKDIEDKIQQFVIRADGRPADLVRCPRPLPAKAGSSIRCEVTSSGGRTYGVTVRATSVEGAEVNYTFNVYEDDSLS